MNHSTHQSSHLWRLAIPIGLGIAMLILVMVLLPAQASAKVEQSFPEDVPQSVTNGDVITIGVAQVLNGSLDWFGWPQLNAVQLAADQVNSAGGIDIGGVPYSVTIVSTDSQCSFDGGMYAAIDLVASDVVAVVGHTCSNSSMGGQSVYDAAGIAMISATSTEGALTDGGYTNTFRTITSEFVPSARLATLLYNHMGIRSVALLEMNNRSYSDLTDVFSDTFTGLGGQVTSRQLLNSSADYPAALTQIDGEGAEAIYFNNHDGAESGLLSSLATTMGMGGVQIAWAPPWTSEREILDDYSSTAGPAAEGDLVLIHYRDVDNMPGYPALQADYVAAMFPNYGANPDIHGAFAYDAAQILFQAIDNADSTDPGDIRVTLAASGYYDGVVGEYYGFDDKGDVIPQWYWFETFREGEWGELLPVGLVADGPTFDDGSFNMMSLQGLTQAENELLVVGETFTSTSEVDYQPNLEQCAENGNVLCISMGFMMNDPTLNAAEIYPATEFAILDGFVDPHPDNLRYISFAHDEAGYLAGVLAGKMTAGNVIGGVGGMQIPPVEAFLNPYAHAASCANPDVTTFITYTNSFGDPHLGAVTAQDQMALGADVIFAAAGATGNGAILTATQSSAWGIGVDSDQYISLFENGAVDGADRLLSSAMKRVDNATFQTIEDVTVGMFSSGEYPMNLANEGVGLAPFHETDPYIPGDVKALLNRVEHGIINGEIDVHGACFADDEITIGVAQALSGGIDWLGWPQLNAVQLAVDQVNSAGGINIGGAMYTVTIVSADCQCSHDAGMDAANDLIDTGAVAVIGHSCSSSSLGGQGVYNAAGIPMISGSSTASVLTEGGYTTTFRTITRDDVPSARLATLLYNHMEIETVALVEMGDWVYWELTDVFSDTFTSLGGQITSRQHITETAAFTDTLTQINGESAEAIFFNGSDGSEAGLFSYQATDMGMGNVQIAWVPESSEYYILDDYTAAAGSAAEGDLVLFHQRNRMDMPGYPAFEADYVAAMFPNYGADPGRFGAFAYDAAQTLIQAIDDADSTAPEDIRDALAASGYYDGVVGEYYGFDDKGDVIPQWYWFEIYREGEWGELVPVGLVSDGPTFDDGSFNMMSLQGLTQAENELLVAGETFTSTNDGEYQPNLEQCAENGNALCISMGFGMNDASLNAAEIYPATKYAVLDGFIDPYPANLRYITFAHDEVGYLAGVLAGEMTTSDVVGAVGGWPIPPVEAFVERYGHAATCANPTATPVLSYTNSFGDPHLGAVTAQDQMALGADVIFAAAGATGNGAVLTATQSGAWGIGVDSDQYISLFENGAVDGADRLLSSAMKRLDNATFQTIEDVVDGLFTPGEYFMNLANAGVGLAPFHETDPYVPASTRNHLLLVEQGIISGDIDIYGACYSMVDIYIPLVIKSP